MTYGFGLDTNAQNPAHSHTQIYQKCVPFTPCSRLLFHLPPPTSSVKVGGQEVATKRTHFSYLSYLSYLFRGLGKTIGKPPDRPRGGEGRGKIPMANFFKKGRKGG